MNEKQNWVIRIRRGTRVVAEWIIEHRRMLEAKDEAMQDPRFAKHKSAKGFSWTLSAGYVGRWVDERI